MKNKTILLFCFGFILLTSCSAWLEEDPRSQMPSDQFFTHPIHARNAVNQLYRTGVPTFSDSPSAYAGGRLMTGGYMSGFMDSYAKGQEVYVDHLLNLTHNPTNISGYLDNLWRPCYSAIARANVAIKNIPLTPDLLDSERKELLAQAKFFRALNYFWLVRYFGDVPLILQPYESAQDPAIYASRTSAAIVYDTIVKDLRYVIEEGGLSKLQMNQNKYRISKTTAQGILASVYLQMAGYPLQKTENYKLAREVCDSVIKSNQYELIKHIDSTANSAYNIMRVQNVQKEYLYTYEYKSGISSAGWRPTYSFNADASNWGVFKFDITQNVYAPTPDFFAIYDTITDLRSQNAQFYHTKFTYTLKRDKLNKPDTTITAKFARAPFFWYEEDAMLRTGIAEKHVVWQRYAEILLIQAEAATMETGTVSPTSIEYLAQIRSRADIINSKQSIITSLTGLSAQQFIEEIWKERLREFPLEFKIWEDIIRTRKYPSTDVNNIGKITFVDFVGATNPFKKVYQEKHLLLPISTNELQRNPNLTQNIGY